MSGHAQNVINLGYNPSVYSCKVYVQDGDKKWAFTILTKVYRLGGETDSAIRWRKRTSCDVGERPEEAGC